MDSNIPYFEDADSALKPGLEPVERETVNVVVWNPRKDEVICLDWKQWGWKTFIIGGVDLGEDPVDAAIREVREETGYRYLKLQLDLGRIRSGYYAAHKEENRIANTTGLLFELVSDERSEVKDADKLPHTFKWVPRSEVADFLSLSSQKYYWKKVVEHLTKLNTSQ